MKNEDLKYIVREKYSEIANQSKNQNQSSCCGSTCGCSDSTYTIFSDDYTHLEGYQPDADLGLGCGLPTEYARLKPGDSVLDLGSGAGNDCFVARAIVGETGKVTGLDFTDAMLEKARTNATKLKFTNVEFVKGDIEEMPFTSSSFDVVISNCVLNLVPDKKKAYDGIFRVLKPGGHFCISDVILSGELPDALMKEAVMYAGCVSGALQMDEYLAIINHSGFENVMIQKQKEIILPDEIMLHYMTPAEVNTFRSAMNGIYSLTVTGNKPVATL